MNSTATYTSHFQEVCGSQMHYLQQGSGDPILFLHGMPTSSYIWRNIMPSLAPLGRCIALDLIGMGKSDKPDIAYTVEDHILYVEKFIEAMNLKRLTIVMHGWGSIMGFHYAMTHETRCKGLAFYEAYVRPFTEADVSLAQQEQILSLDALSRQYDFEMNGIDFVDKALMQAMMSPLTNEEMRHYREPFFPDNAGKPLLQYFKELPRDKQDTPVNRIITAYSQKLMHSQLPKLMLYSVPGFVTTMETAMWAKSHLPKLELADIGEELHYAQESNPELMGDSISVWLQAIEQT